MKQIILIYVFTFGMFIHAASAPAADVPETSVSCSEGLDGPDIEIGQVTRLGALKQNFRSLPWRFERVRKSHGFFVSLIEMAIATPMSLAPLFKFEKSVRPPALSQDFIGPHLKNAFAVIDRIVEEGKRIGLNLTPSDAAVYLSSDMDLSPNRALTIQHSALGSLVLNTALGNLEIYRDLSAPMAHQILAALAQELGLEEFVMEGDGRMRLNLSGEGMDLNNATLSPSQKRLAVLHLPTGETLPYPEMIRVEGYRPNEEIKNRWNLNKPANRRPIVSDRVRNRQFGWRDL